MSCSTSIIYGYGFNISTLTANGFINFLTWHSESVIAILQKQVGYKHLTEADLFETLKTTGPEEFFSEIECEISGFTGWEAVISNVITHETDIRVEYQSGESHGDETIMFSEGMPWIYSNKEKLLTQDYLEDLFSKYINDLHLECEPCYVVMEYFG